MSRDAASRPARPQKSAKLSSSAISSSTKRASGKRPNGAQAATPKAGWFERLKRRFRFARQGKNIHPSLEDPVEKAATAKRESKVAAASDTGPLLAALKDVLDRDARSRSVLVHLGLLERALKRRGLNVLDELPPDLMKRALSQLETLVSDWAPSPIATLRTKLQAALLVHERAGDHRSTAERLSDFHDDKRMQVGESSVTVFMEANAEWERSSTGQALK